MNDVTRILSAIEQGDPQAAEQLLPLVYDELRKLAAQRLAQEKPGQTLQATALVHEAYLRLVDAEKSQRWDEPRPLLRRRGRGDAAHPRRERPPQEAAQAGRRSPAASSSIRSPSNEELADDRLLAVDEALTELDREDPQAAQLVKLRFFAGLSITDAAELLGISRATADEVWAYARAWLRCEVEDVVAVVRPILRNPSRFAPAPWTSLIGAANGQQRRIDLGSHHGARRS